MMYNKKVYSRGIVERMNLFGNLGGLEYISLAIEEASNGIIGMKYDSVFYLSQIITIQLEMLPQMWIRHEVPKLLCSLRKVFQSFKPKYMIAGKFDIETIKLGISTLYHL